MKVTGRDIKIFLLGMLFMFLIVLAYDWESFRRGFAGEPERATQSMK
ncbi:MAG: hypothetical protein ACMVP2_01910 [Imperialibacter sp.]